ncbi:helix-turn-helix domain-containing protein [Caldimonas tepidiphila]|uniref:helix-turn-helix domain-containing protein n=1 Tax=Caldimonas tepidiphila TaxID=2315841 RepID=UPI0013003A22|nr:helix-turn-helix domain-containing protein [Caldimonas tepidiphila]
MPRAPRLQLDPAARQQAVDLGARIRLARQRRRLRLEDVAQKTGMSRATVEAVERGELTTAFGAYVSILGVLGLLGELALLADPGLDREGLALEFSVADKRVRVQRRDLGNDF